MVAPSSKFYSKIWVGFCLNTAKLFLEVSSKSKQKEQALAYEKNGMQQFHASSQNSEAIDL